MLKDRNKLRIALINGFSLIELLVVVAIISVLGALGFIGYTKYIQSAKKGTNEANAKSLADALAAEAIKPTHCTDALALNDPNNYKGVNDSGNMAIVLCANKILLENNFRNPFSGQPYSTLNISSDGEQHQLVANKQNDLAWGSSADGTPCQWSPDGSKCTAMGVYLGADATQVIGWWGNSGPIFCSDQLNGMPVLDKNNYFYNFDSNGNSVITSPGAGLLIVVDGVTQKFGVAACNPYSTNPNGVIGPIFTVNNDQPVN
jgi:prepilin-type N-terminal cleavage/methylation domain-containing protein